MILLSRSRSDVFPSKTWLKERAHSFELLGVPSDSPTVRLMVTMIVQKAKASVYGYQMCSECSRNQVR